MKITRSVIVFIISALVCVPLLVYLTLSGQGMSKTNLVSVTAIIKLVAAAAAVAMLVMSLKSTDNPEYLPEKKGILPGIFSLLATAAYGFLGIAGLLDKKLKLFSLAAETAEETDKPDVISIVYTVFLIIVAITFLFYAIGFLAGNNMAGSYVLLPLMPILYSMLRLMLTFFENTRSAVPGERDFEILAIITTLLFFVSSGKLTVGSSEKASKLAFGSGSAAMLFIALSLVSPVIALAKNTSGLSSALKSSHLLPDGATLLFIAGYLIFAAGGERASQPARSSASSHRVSSRPTLLTGGRASESEQSYVPEIVAQPLESSYKSAPVKSSSSTRYSAPVPPRRDGSDMIRQQKPASRQRAGYSAPVPPRRVPIGYRLEADELTPKGAGMQVTDEFRIGNTRRRRSTVRYDGLDAFRREMKGGKTALDVLDSSKDSDGIPEIPDGIKPINPFEEPAAAAAAATTAESLAAAAQMGENLEKEVEESIVKINERRSGKDRRVGDRVGGRRSTDKQPEEVIVAPDESGPETEEVKTDTAANDLFRDVKLSEGGSMSDKIMQQRREAEAQAQQAQQAQQQMPNPYMNPYQGMGMMGMGMGAMGMGMTGMGMGMGNPYDPYSSFNNPYSSAFNSALNGGEDEDEDEEDEEYYDDDYDFDEEPEEESYDDGYDDYGDYDEEYDEDAEYDDYDDYGDYDEDGEYYGDDEYYDDGEDYGTYDMTDHSWN